MHLLVFLVWCVCLKRDFLVFGPPRDPARGRHLGDLPYSVELCALADPKFRISNHGRELSNPSQTNWKKSWRRAKIARAVKGEPRRTASVLPASVEIPAFTLGKRKHHRGQEFRLLWVIIFLTKVAGEWMCLPAKWRYVECGILRMLERKGICGYKISHFII